MRCPDCGNRMSNRKYTCKKCGYRFSYKDFIKPNAYCPLFDICNYAEDCEDRDWEHCGTYVCLGEWIGRMS